MSVTLRLEDEIDISRGDMIVGMFNQPHVLTEHEANLAWMAEAPLQLGKKYTIKHNTNTQRVIVTDLKYKVNIHTLENEAGATTLGLNDIGRVRFKTTKPLVYDNYRKSRGTGSFILIDEATNATVAAGMLHSPVPEAAQPEFDGPVI